MVDDCFICRKHQGQIEIPGGLLLADELVVVTRPANIDYPAYLMLDTTRHVWELADLTTLESEAVGRTVSRMARALGDVCGVVHVYSFYLADGVPHAHFHVVGRSRALPQSSGGGQSQSGRVHLGLGCPQPLGQRLARGARGAC